MLGVLRHRNFFLLFAAALISSAGDWVLYAAVPYYVYARSGSALASGLTFALEIAPSIIFGTVGGVLADRWNRRRAIVIGQVLMSVALLPPLLAPLSALLPVLYAAVLSVAILSQVTLPATSAALPIVVGKEHLVAANSALSASNNLARIIGSALGGALMATFGLHAVVGVDALSFLLAGGCVAAIDVPLQGTRTSTADDAAGVWRRTWDEWLEGIRFVLRERWIAILFIVVGIAVFGDGMFTVVLPTFVRHTLHAGPLAFGWALTARGVGGLLGTLVMPWLSTRISVRALIGWSAVTDGIIVLLIASLSSVPSLVVLTVAIGTPVVGFYVSIPTLLQRHVRDEIRGRIFGAYGAFAQLMVLTGMLLTGVAADRTGILPWVFVCGGLYAFAGIVALVLLSPPAQPDHAVSHTRA